MKLSMINRITLLLTFCLLTLCSYSQNKNDSIIYTAVVQFQSECCGVPDEAPLIKFIRAFKKENKIKRIKVYHIGPMGKEGEYYLAFALSELKKKQKLSFIRKLKIVAARMKDKGSASVEEKMLLVKSEMPSRVVFEQKFY
jgi:hypothetical protein